MKHSLLLLVFTMVSLFSCGDDEDCCVLPPECVECCEIILDEEKLGTVSTENYNITNIKIEDDCLILSIQGSGCNGSTWGSYLFSGPVIIDNNNRSLSTVLELFDNEDCDAIVGRDFSYDISYLSKPTTINIIGYDESIVYE